jgi:hypothetical protein
MVATNRATAPSTLHFGNITPTCAPSFGVLKMHVRTRRALAAVAEMDARRILLCPTCEGLLLTAAAGLPLPLVRDEDGEMTDGDVYVDALLDRILAVDYQEQCGRS